MRQWPTYVHLHSLVAFNLDYKKNEFRNKLATTVSQGGEEREEEGVDAIHCIQTGHSLLYQMTGQYYNVIGLFKKKSQLC